jgi:hypothetical protein
MKQPLATRNSSIKTAWRSSLLTHGDLEVASRRT